MWGPSPGCRRYRGRFERVTASPGAPEPGFEVIVDYAHTDVGLEAALGVAREVASEGRIICVFGAAGDRDGAKRPLMGRAASRLSDVAIITTDDAYSEDPQKIAHEVESGVETGSEEIEVILDRREAIRHALSLARPGDVVLLAGQGTRAGPAPAGGRCGVPRRHRGARAARRAGERHGGDRDGVQGDKGCVGRQRETCCGG